MYCAGYGERKEHMMRSVIVFFIAAAIATGVTPAYADVRTAPATGTLTFTTGPGITSTWDRAGLRVAGLAPGVATTLATPPSITIELPIVARTRTANAAAGGFRITNTLTNATFMCASPTIDIKASAVDCVRPDGTNFRLFKIMSIDSRIRLLGNTTLTRVFRGIRMQIASASVADELNNRLATRVFSPSVVTATGDLIVTYRR